MQMCALRLPAFFFFFLIRLEVCWQSFWNCQEDRWGSFAIIISWNTLTWACAQFSGGQNKIVHVPINIKVNETTEEKKQKKLGSHWNSTRSEQNPRGSVDFLPVYVSEFPKLNPEDQCTLIGMTFQGICIFYSPSAFTLCSISDMARIYLLSTAGQFNAISRSKIP